VTRKDFISASLAAFAGVTARGALPDSVSRKKYPGWRSGELDIHFIHTGTGEQTFFIFPDGTTMLLDCGHETWRRPEYVAAIPPCPDGSRRGGEWVARYIAGLTGKKDIDYLMASHWHTDHISEFPFLAERFRFGRFFDHQFPRRRGYSSDASEGDYEKVMAWLDKARGEGLQECEFTVGRNDQIKLLHDRDGRYSSDFEVRNIAANGVVWDGKGAVRDCAAEHVKATGAKRLEENMLSAAIRIRYGKFTYYSGGDLEKTFTAADGSKYCYEGLVGRVTGRVDVCKANHHSFWAAMQAPFVKAVRPRVILSSSWSPNQINERNLPIMASRELYSGDRDIYFGCIPEEKRKLYRGRDFMSSVVPFAGHTVVKVAPGGGNYSVMVLSAADEEKRIVFERSYTSAG
jgi:beta-lactamase superfamily II metal-dependent hydrolase